MAAREVQVFQLVGGKPSSRRLLLLRRVRLIQKGQVATIFDVSAHRAHDYPVDEIERLAWREPNGRVKSLRSGSPAEAAGAIGPAAGAATARRV